MHAGHWPLTLILTLTFNSRRAMIMTHVYVTGLATQLIKCWLTKTTTTTYDGPRNFLLLLILFSLIKFDNVFTFSHISSTTTALAEVIPRRRGRPRGEWPISASLVGDRPPPGARWSGAAGCCCCGWQDDGWGWRGPTCVGPALRRNVENWGVGLVPPHYIYTKNQS